MNNNRIHYKRMFEEAGIKVDVRNFITDYTLPTGKREHIANQTLQHGMRGTDAEVIDRIKKELPPGSRICTIYEVMGDYSLEELSRMATSMALLRTEKKCIYIDAELAAEYMQEWAQEMGYMRP